jgi:hypothetical protein
MRPYPIPFVFTWSGASWFPQDAHGSMPTLKASVPPMPQPDRSRPKRLATDPKPRARTSSRQNCGLSSASRERRRRQGMGLEQAQAGDDQGCGEKAQIPIYPHSGSPRAPVCRHGEPSSWADAVGGVAQRCDEQAATSQESAETKKARRDHKQKRGQRVNQDRNGTGLDNQQQERDHQHKHGEQPEPIVPSARRLPKRCVSFIQPIRSGSINASVNVNKPSIDTLNILLRNSTTEANQPEGPINVKSVQAA